MIIKSSRIPTERTAQIAQYLNNSGENERTHWLQGDSDTLFIMGEISRLAGKPFSVRHVIVSPEIDMTYVDLSVVLDEYCNEYLVPKSSRFQMCIVEHQKPRASEHVSSRHWHVALPETSADLRTLDSRFTRMRDEKIGRLCELRLGHPVVKGRFDKQVDEWISINRPELAIPDFHDRTLAVPPSDKGSAEWAAPRTN